MAIFPSQHSNLRHIRRLCDVYTISGGPSGGQLHMPGRQTDAPGRCTRDEQKRTNSKSKPNAKAETWAEFCTCPPPDSTLTTTCFGYQNCEGGVGGRGKDKLRKTEVAVKQIPSFDCLVRFMLRGAVFCFSDLGGRSEEMAYCSRIRCSRHHWSCLCFPGCNTVHLGNG